MGPIWGWQDPGGPHVGPMNLAIWVTWNSIITCYQLNLYSVQFYSTSNRFIKNSRLNVSKKIICLISNIMTWQYFHLIDTIVTIHNQVVSPRPSIRPSVRPASRVRSVAPTVLVRSISYLYILSSHFKGCDACKFACKISKCEFLAIFKNI